MRTDLALDHFFCFCPSDLPEAAVLEGAGFFCAPPLLHRGQGTGCRCVIFEENYLELIYLESREEAEENPLLLHRRADWQKTGYCPFGIALRGNLSAEDRAAFWEYHPPYRPERTILIHKSNEMNPAYPLLFVMEPAADRPKEAMRPVLWNRGEEFLARLRHPSGTKRINGLEISCLSSSPWPLSVPVAGVRVASGPRFSAEVTLDGSFGDGCLPLNSLLTLKKEFA